MSPFHLTYFYDLVSSCRICKEMLRIKLSLTWCDLRFCPWLMLFKTEQVCLTLALLFVFVSHVSLVMANEWEEAFF